MKHVRPRVTFGLFILISSFNLHRPRTQRREATIAFETRSNRSLGECVRCVC